MRGRAKWWGLKPNTKKRRKKHEKIRKRTNERKTKIMKNSVKIVKKIRGALPKKQNHSLSSKLKMVSGSEHKKERQCKERVIQWPKEKNRKILKRIFGQMCIAQKTTGSKTSKKQRLHLNSRCWHFFEKTSVKISEKLPLRFPVCNFKRRFSSIKNKNGNRQKRATASRQKFVLPMEGAGKIPEKNPTI